jgi:hypothetical protein
MLYIPVNYVVLIFICHFIGDFLLQSDKMAVNKSKDWWQLTRHVLAYSVPFMLFGYQYALLNAGLHFFVDALTSRMTSYFWKNDMRHEFFVTIGFDQMIHMMMLVGTISFIKL